MRTLAIATSGLLGGTGGGTGDECPPCPPTFNGVISLDTPVFTIIETYIGFDIITKDVGVIIMDSQKEVTVNNTIIDSIVIKDT